jgi:hypothetical protein
MIRILKPIVSFLMFFVVLFFIGTILTIATEFPDWVCVVLALSGAILVAWYTWKLVSGEKMGTGVSVLCGALMLGGLGFIIGFLGPMILVKDTSQGAFVGIFITAPLGVILGAMGGYIYATKQNKSVSD